MKLENVTLTSFTKLSFFRSQVDLLNELKFVNSSSDQPVSITVPYKDILVASAFDFLW